MGHVKALCEPRAKPGVCVWRQELYSVTELLRRELEGTSEGGGTLASDLEAALGSPDVWGLTGENSLKPGVAYCFIKGQKVFSASRATLYIVFYNLLKI